MSKILTAYFSATGTTKKLAQAIAKEAGADLFEIKPAVPYTSADLDWTNKASRSTKEMNDPSSRPEIAEKVSDMSQYDTVLIGFPVWWYVSDKFYGFYSIPISLSQACISAVLTEENLLPFFHSAVPLSFLRIFSVFPNPLPPDVANTAIFLPEKS